MFHSIQMKVSFAWQHFQLFPLGFNWSKLRIKVRLLFNQCSMHMPIVPFIWICWNKKRSTWMTKCSSLFKHSVPLERRIWTDAKLGKILLNKLGFVLNNNNILTGLIIPKTAIMENQEISVHHISTSNKKSSTQVVLVPTPCSNKKIVTSSTSPYSSIRIILILWTAKFVIFV